MSEISRRGFFKAVGLVVAASALGSCSSPASDKVRNQIVWSGYKAGTASYNDIAALANLVTSKTGVPVRLMSSDTGIGRMAPLLNGTADFARGADETYYAFEGDEEFASEVWGPQPIRQIWTPPAQYGVLVLKKSGIETADQLKGVRYPDLIAATAMNRKLEATLTFGGLTLDDVTLVPLGYGEQAAALKAGHIDAMFSASTSAAIEELATEYPFRWIELGGGSPEQYSAWEELVPTMRTGVTSSAAGLDEGQSVEIMEYSTVLSTLESQDADRVYDLLALIDEHFDEFTAMTPDAKSFAPDVIMRTPLVVPFHEGTIRFLDEKGLWPEDLNRRNEALLQRAELMLEAWPDFWENHDRDQSANEQWKKWKKENLPKLPPVQTV